MARAHSFAILGVATILGACGGSGGGTGSGGGNTGGTPTPTISTLPVTLSASSTNYSLAEGGTRGPISFTASYTGTPSGTVVPDVQISGGRVALTSAVASGASYAVQLAAAEFQPAGQTANTVTFRLCTDAACGTVYPGSTQTFTVNLTVQLKDWSTFQRDAAHTGYVPVKYDAGKFPAAATWQVSTGTSRPSAVAARAGSVFANFYAEPNSTRVETRSIAADTGAIRWRYDLGPSYYVSAPSYANGRVVSAVMDISSGSVPMPVIDANDGRVLRVLSYASQFAQAGAPVPSGDDLFHQAGYYGNVVYAYNTATGTSTWSSSAGVGTVHEGESLGVDDRYVYFYSGGALNIFNRADGTVYRSIPDPFFSRAGLSYYGSYYGAPILDGKGNIFTFSDNRGSNQPSAIIAFALDQTRFVWRTSGTYVGHPALRGGKLYAPRSNSTIIDVIDTANGSVTASIDVGATKAKLTSNVIATESHLFVGSESETYAIDLLAGGNPVVWTAATGGALALSPDNLLIVTGSTGMTAYRLN